MCVCACARAPSLWTQAHVYIMMSACACAHHAERKMLQDGHTSLTMHFPHRYTIACRPHLLRCACSPICLSMPLCSLSLPGGQARALPAMGKAARPASELERRSRREGGKQAPALTAKTWEKWLGFVKAQAGPRMHFIVWLTGALGLRCGEAVALRREDFALDAEEPYVRAAGHVTGAKKSPGYALVKRSSLSG